jgi:hypothetical protein
MGVSAVLQAVDRKIVPESFPHKRKDQQLVIIVIYK